MEPLEEMEENELEESGRGIGGRLNTLDSETDNGDNNNEIN